MIVSYHTCTQHEHRAGAAAAAGRTSATSRLVSHADAPPKHAVMHAVRAESEQREECEGEAARTGQEDGHAERNANAPLSTATSLGQPEKRFPIELIRCMSFFAIRARSAPRATLLLHT